MKKKMIITDLDGTLNNDHSQISDKDLKTLKKLGDTKAINVIATGRSLFSAINNLPSEIPINYLIFSTGAGIFDWKTKQIIFKNQLSKLDVIFIFDKIKKYQLDFSIQKEIPNNHEYFYFKNLEENSDFDKRNNLYGKYSQKIKISDFNFANACQFLIVEPNKEKGLKIIEILKDELFNYKIIRATSPLDKKSVWIEIFDKKVSKANAANLLAKKLGIAKQDTFALGNDYNDYDLLEWSPNSFVVENAPEDLKKKYKKTKSNNNNGFSDFIEQTYLLSK